MWVYLVLVEWDSSEYIPVLWLGLLLLEGRKTRFINRLLVFCRHRRETGCRKMSAKAAAGNEEGTDTRKMITPKDTLG